MNMQDKEVVLAVLASTTQIIILLINTKYTVSASQASEKNGKKLSKLNRDVQDSISLPYLSAEEKETLRKEQDEEQRRRGDI